MAAKVRRERAKESLRQEIIDAARELFVKEGYATVSMRKIADKIEYSPTTIYLYFRDKSDLLSQICEQAFAQLTKNIIAVQKRANDPLEKLRLGLFEYIHFGLDHPSHYEIIFISPLSLAGPVNFNKSAGKAAFETLRNSVEECVAENLLESNDVDLISQTLWAGIHGITSLLIKHKDFPFVGKENLIERMVHTLIKGIKA